MQFRERLAWSNTLDCATALGEYSQSRMWPNWEAELTAIRLLGHSPQLTERQDAQTISCHNSWTLLANDTNFGVRSRTTRTFEDKPG